MKKKEIPLTAQLLNKLGYKKPTKNGITYFQKGVPFVIYRDSGVWDFCAEQGDPMCGIPITTLEDLNYYLTMPKK